MNGKELCTDCQLFVRKTYEEQVKEWGVNHAGWKTLIEFTDFKYDECPKIEKNEWGCLPYMWLVNKMKP
jgi:hypothetical protein